MNLTMTTVFNPATVPALLKARQVLALATTRAKVAAMEGEGYKVDATDRPWLFFVRRPKPHIDRRTGEITEGYFVDLLEADTTCTCPQFLACGDCKHRIFTLTAVRKSVALTGVSLLGGAQ